MKSLWPILFKIGDPFLKFDGYLKFKSKKLPQEKVERGMTVSCDPAFKIPPKKTVIRKSVDINFYRSRKTDDVFEVSSIALRANRTYYTLLHVASNTYITIDEQAFRLLFIAVKNPVVDYRQLS